MPPKTRPSNKKPKTFGSSPVPVAEFMAPPGARKKPVAVVKPASAKKPVAKKSAPPSKAAAARDLEIAAKTLLKLSRQLKG